MAVLTQSAFAHHTRSPLEPLPTGSRQHPGSRQEPGTIAVEREAASQRYLFPDTEDAIAGFQALKAGEVHRLDLAQITNK